MNITVNPKTIGWHLGLLGLILILTFLIRVPFLTEPFECDQGVFAYTAWSWQQGRIPYLELFDNKPPLLYLFMRLIFNLFGYSVRGIHLAYAILAVFSTFIFYQLSRLIFKDRLALLSTFLYGLFSGGALISGSFANSENLMIFFVIFAFYLFWKAAQEKKNPLFFLSSILIGLAMMSKQTALFEGMGMSLFLYIIYKRRGQRLLGLKRIGIIWLVAGAIFLSNWLYFILQGAGRDFIYSMFTFNLFFGRIVGLQQAVINFWKSLSWTPRENFLLWILAVWGMILAIKKKDELSIFLLIWVFSALLGISAGLRFYHHYFIQAIPILVLLTIFALQNSFWQRRYPTWKRLLGIGMLMVMLAFFIRIQWNYYFRYSPSESLVNRRGSLARKTYKQAPRMAAYLREKTQPEDYIYIWGLWPEIYFYAQRQVSSRYCFFPTRGIFIGRFACLVHQQVLADTFKNKPKYFIIDPQFADLLSEPLVKHLKENYLLEDEIADFQILRRRE